MNKLGQLFITGISSTELTLEEEQFIRDENIGGVILFKENYESPAQLAELINNIQSLREDYPLLIAVDHEGGRVQRFKEGFTRIPDMLTLGDSKSPKACFNVFQVMAKELLACGVNVNLGPVCDIFTNPKNAVIGDRAFGREETDVSQFVSAAIRGQQTSGLISCAKHFPGHGDTLLDSHIALPIVEKSLEDLKNLEFLPFVKAVKSRVDMVMMAHLKVDAIDKDNICTFSKNAYDLIRGDLKFKKIIITDDMEMKAINEELSFGEASSKAINAGADLVEYRSFEACKAAYDYCKENASISRDRLTDSFARVLELKKSYLSNYAPTYIPDLSKSVGTQENQQVVDEITKV